MPEHATVGANEIFHLTADSVCFSKMNKNGDLRVFLTGRK